jgi:hypothetical protein
MIQIARIAAVSLCVAAAVLAITVIIGRWRFRTRVASDVSVLLSSPAPAVGPMELAAREVTLPEPVRRYLRYAIPAGAPAIRTVHLRHAGFFRTKPNAPWLPIRGEQYFTTGRPGFVWNATVRMKPFFWPFFEIDARDRLFEGRGNMLVKLASTFTVADATGLEIDQGSSLRWLAETAWFPYAVVSDAIRWEAIDAHSARATLVQDGLPATAVFEFDDEGKPKILRASRYYSDGNAPAKLLPWTGRYLEYREFGGFRVPSYVEVSWQLPEGEFSYARFRVTEIRYSVAVPDWVFHLPRSLR